MDALAVLRDYTIRNDLDKVKVSANGDEYYFGDEYRFPRNVETLYRSKQGSRYTLDSLVFFVKNKHVKHTEYMQQARVSKLQIVTFTDRKPLQDYLEGKVSSTDAIELLPSATGLPLREDRPKRHTEVENEAVDGDENNAPSKRTKMEPDGYPNAGILTSDASRKSLIEIIRDRERPVRDRESILICPNKNFQGVLALLKGRDDERRRADEQVKKEAEKPTEQPGMPASNSGSRYVNVEEKRFWKDHLGTDAAEELGIDPSQSYADSIKPKDNSRPRPDTRVGRPPSQHLLHRPPLASSGHKKPEGPPIIIVPSASQTMLNTYNAKEFFEDGIYISPDLKAKSLSKKPEDVVIYRKMGRDHPVKYEIRDKPSVFSKKDWERVVAIFVLGKEWQFKDWPFKDHVEIFNQILGIFLRFDDDSVESAQKVKQWNVRILSLSKHKRHQDRTAVLAFWDSLDKSVKSRKLNVII